MRWIAATSGALFCVLLIHSCQKDYSYEGGKSADSAALFQIISSDDACSVVLTSGSYLAGIGLSSNEKITVEVEVLRPGKWEYSTDTLNGYYFSAEGTFRNTGKQNIVLQGGGTPDMPGNSVFTFNRSVAPMHHVVSVLDVDLQLESVPAEIYFRGTVDGVEYQVISPITDPDHITFAGSFGDTAVFTSYASTGAYPTPPGTGTLGIQKQYLYHYRNISEAGFKAFFKPGAYPYIDQKCFGMFRPNGVIIFWNDHNADWRSMRTLGNQPGSSFKIVGIQDGHTSSGKYYVKTFAKFNCTLYSGTKDPVTLTDGEAVTLWIREPSW